MGGRFDSDAKRWRMRASLMSRLTCYSTRNALYNSFRDGTRENIGDITAKGEASIAVVDLLGIATEVSLSTKVGTSVGAVLAV
jgi:hypothetical protein